MLTTTKRALPRYLSAGALIAITAGAASAGAASAAPTEPTPDATCGPLKIAYVFDLSRSYSDSEFATQKQQAKDSIRQLGAADGAGDVNPSVAIYTFGRQSAVADGKLIGTDGTTYDTVQDMQAAGAGLPNAPTVAAGYQLEEVPANAALGLTNVATESGRNTVLDKIDGLQRDQRLGTNARTAGDVEDGSSTKPVYGDSDGTNWDGALQAVQNSGEHYDAVIVVTDGLPNMVAGQDSYGHQGPLQEGESVDGGFRTTQVAADAATERAKALSAQGTKVVPLFIKSTSGDDLQPETMEAKMRFIAQLSAVPDAKEGTDYFTVENTASLAPGLLGAATATCDPVAKIDKKIADDTDLATLKAGSTVMFDVTTKGAGNVASHEVVVDDLGGAKIVEGSAVFTDISKGSITKDGKWAVGDLAVDETATAKVTVTLAEDFKPGDTFTNDINVSTQRDPEGPTTGDGNTTVDEDEDRFDREETKTPTPEPEPAPTPAPSDGGGIEPTPEPTTPAPEPMTPAPSPEAPAPNVTPSPEAPQAKPSTPVEQPQKGLRSNTHGEAERSPSVAIAASIVGGLALVGLGAVVVRVVRRAKG